MDTQQIEREIERIESMLAAYREHQSRIDPDPNAAWTTRALRLSAEIVGIEAQIQELREGLISYKQGNR